MSFEFTMSLSTGWLKLDLWTTKLSYKMHTTCTVDIHTIFLLLNHVNKKYDTTIGISQACINFIWIMTWILCVIHWLLLVKSLTVVVITVNSIQSNSIHLRHISLIEYHYDTYVIAVKHSPLLIIWTPCVHQEINRYFSFR